MTSRSSASRFSKAIFSRAIDNDVPDQPLPLHVILEEEYAALHPDAVAPPPGNSCEFGPGDIADLPGFVRALLSAQARLDARMASNAWRPRPPAPDSTVMHEVAAVVVRDEPLLVRALRLSLTCDETARNAADGEARRRLAARLTSLLSADLGAEASFKPFVLAIQRADADGAGPNPSTDQNRALLEAAFEPFLATERDRRLSAVFARIRDAEHRALCLSGGGIRSASFAMGVVQGLARRGLLSGFDYMSTVSGGGYTGSWLSAWMARSSARTVCEQLRGARTSKTEPEPAPIRHVRTFSYYLNPSLGMLSADTWTLVATVLRNIVLIWVVTLPFIAAAVMIPRLFVSGPMMTLRDWAEINVDPADLFLALLLVGVVLAVGAMAFLHRHLHAMHGDAHKGGVAVTARTFLMRCLLPLVIAAAMFAQAWEMGWSMVRFTPEDAARFLAPLSRHAWAMQIIELDPRTINTGALALLSGAVFWMFVYVAGWVIGLRGRRHKLDEGILVAVTGAMAGVLGAFATMRMFGLTEWRHPPEFYATFAVPMELAGILVAMLTLVGLTSRRMTDAERESNARFSAWLLIAIVAWIVTFGIALYGPLELRQLIEATRWFDGRVGSRGIAALAVVLLAVLVRVGGPGLSPSATPHGGARPGTGRRLVGALATPLFAVAVIVLVSLLDASLLGSACGVFTMLCARDNPGGGTDLFAGRDAATLTVADFAPPQLVLGAIALLLVLGYVLGRLINTNRFSLHAMYRERLVRTFLGASKPPGDREPRPFTGFDPTDDMPVADLWPATQREAERSPEGASHPPIHVVNLSLNLVAGAKLSEQSRKAESFTVTPLHAGAASVGYRRTSAPEGTTPRLYGGEHGVSLGTAMAVSGAAASPNAGYHSSPIMTFLMTLFNARLGWWLGNPGPAGDTSYDRDEPQLAVVPILEEMFGRTTSASPYVYLSDGGHFENLGLYEMVRRRCRFVVVSDAGCDPKGRFDDLGGAIRKIRIDFGIPVEFDAGIHIYARGSAEPRADATYWAVGRIRYSCADKDEKRWPGKTDADYDGVILYIKPAFYGSESRDVFNYAASTPDFPHESTNNQFFGEAQFESYRALGSHVIDQLCETEFAIPRGSSDPVDDAALRHWLAARLRSD